MRAAWVVVLLVAGCAGNAPATEPAEGPALQATGTTGVLRGVVVDQTIQPIVGASVVAVGPGEAKTVTNTQGYFGVDGLEPGSYTITAHKEGYASHEIRAEVVAAVDEPPLVKLVLDAVAGNEPFFSQLYWSGHVQCSFSGSNTCAAINILFPNATDDRGLIVAASHWTGQQRHPDWIVAETTWEPSATAVSSLSMMHTAASKEEVEQGDLYHIGRFWVHGDPPLSLTWNRTFAEQHLLGTLRDPVYLATNGPVGLVSPPIPEDARVGMALNQPFDFFLHTFYGYVPSEEWRFLSDGEVPGP